MNQNNYVQYLKYISPEKTGKVSSYIRAIMIVDELFVQRDVFGLHGRSLFTIDDIELLVRISDFIKAEEKKMKKGESSIFIYGNSKQTSYPLKGFCSAAILSLIRYAQFENDVLKANEIVQHSLSARQISKNLIQHFDLTKIGEDKVSVIKVRVGQDYFRRMILSNYEGKCALTGIDIPTLLVASHIIPWKESKQKEVRLNPENGICLSVLYDKAFDKGLITFDKDCRVLFSNQLQSNVEKDYYTKYFVPIEGQKLHQPTRYAPNLSSLSVIAIVYF